MSGFTVSGSLISFTILRLGASVLDRANISIGLIQRILGHENRTTTEIYLHSIDEIDRVAMEYLGAQIEKSLTQILTQKKLRVYDNLV